MASVGLDTELPVQNPLPFRARQLAVAMVVAAALAVATASTAGAASQSWTFSALGVPPERPAGNGVTVAVIDSGIDMGHPAFRGRIAASVDCVGSAGDPDRCAGRGVDDNGHGTHIAGIIAARSVNGGPEGVAPGAEILAVRSLSNTCDTKGDHRQCRALGELGDVVAGVRWATARGADVINLSIDAGAGLDWRDGDLAGAVSDAWASGAVVVASTGNRSETITDPDLETVPLVLVGAITAEGVTAEYSNLPGTARWALMGPGGEAGGECPTDGVLSAYPRSVAAAGTGCLSGTSMAAAYVSGALATLIDGGLGPHVALAHLLATAVPGADAPVPDLGRALRTPAAEPPEEFTAGLAAESRRRAEQGDGEISSAAGLPLEEWTRVHPIRVRAAATGVVVAVLAFVAARRARARPWLLGY